MVVPERLPTLDEIAADAQCAEGLPQSVLVSLLLRAAAAQTTLTVRLTAAPETPAAAQSEERDKLLTVKEAAERLRRSTKWIYRATATGSLPFARRIGNALMFSESGLEKWVARQKA